MRCKGGIKELGLGRWLVRSRGREKRTSENSLQASSLEAGKIKNWNMEDRGAPTWPENRFLIALETGIRPCLKEKASEAPVYAQEKVTKMWTARRLEGSSNEHCDKALASR